MYSPPFGEAHLLSNLPRPAVCSSARTTVPSLTPALPNLSAVNWVEASLLYSLSSHIILCYTCTANLTSLQNTCASDAFWSFPAATNTRQAADEKDWPWL